MADFRQIHTSIWDDEWYCQLPSDTKIVFVWLFSNRRAAVSGLYQFTEFICSRETGLPIESVKSSIKKLTDDGKIYVEGDWVWVKNLRKYNYYKNDNADKRIQKDLSQLPNNGLKKAYIEYYKPLDTPLIPTTTPLLEQEQEQEQEIEHEKEKEKEQDTKKAAAVFKIYENNIGMLTSVIADKINADIQEYSEQWVCDAIIEATRQEKRSLAYAEGILKRWKRDGKNDKKKEEPKMKFREVYE